MLTIKSEHKYSEYHFARKFQDNISTSNKISEQLQEGLNPLKKNVEKMIKIQGFKEKYHDILRNSSSLPIQNKVLTITSENPSSEDHFNRKFQAKMSTYNPSFEKQEE